MFGKIVHHASLALAMLYFVAVMQTEATFSAEQQDQIVIVAGLPSALGHHAARVYQDQGYALAPFGLTFEDNVPKYVFAHNSQKGNTEKVHLLNLNNIYETEHTLRKYLGEVQGHATVSLVDTIGDDAVQYLGEALELPVVEFGANSNKKESSMSTTAEPSSIDLDDATTQELEQEEKTKVEKKKTEPSREEQIRRMEAQAAQERAKYVQQQQQQQQQRQREWQLQQQQQREQQQKARRPQYRSPFFNDFMPSYWAPHRQYYPEYQQRYPQKRANYRDRRRNWMTDLFADPFFDDFFHPRQAAAYYEPFGFPRHSMFRPGWF